MAHEINLPCDKDGVCMRCKANPPPEESLVCGTCGTPWHVSCLLTPPETLASTLLWDCPDCSGEIDPLPASVATGIDASGSGSHLVAAIRAIEADESLTDADKAKQRQVLMSGKMDEEQEKESNGDLDILAAVGELLKCLCCFQLLERPVTVSFELETGLANLL